MVLGGGATEEAEDWARPAFTLGAACGIRLAPLGGAAARTLDAKRLAATVGLADDHPVFWRADTVIAMAKMADLISEDKLITPEQATNRLSPETQAKGIVTNPENPDYKAYYDPSHGRHQEVVQCVNAHSLRAGERGESVTGWAHLDPCQQSRTARECEWTVVRILEHEAGARKGLKLQFRCVDFR